MLVAALISMWVMNTSTTLMLLPIGLAVCGVMSETIPDITDKDRSNFDTALQAQPYAIKRTQMIADRDSVNTQVSLENTNLVGIRTYVETLTDNLAYSALAEDTGMRQVLINTSQNANFKQYFENYDLNEEYRNPLIDTDDDDEKESRIDTG